MYWMPLSYRYYTFISAEQGVRAGARGKKIYIAILFHGIFHNK